MPSLKDVSCTIELSESQHSLREFGTIYGDGFVETFVPVPSKPQPFSVHLTSNKFIAPGVAIFVYIDGVYQCNRNRQDLKLRKPSDSRSLVDFRVRQKEEKQKDGSMIAREWAFDKLKIASADDAPNLCSPNILENIGCIEVLVLRCAGSRNAKSASTMNFDGAGDWPGHYCGLDQNSSPSNERSMYDDHGPYFKDPVHGLGPPPPLSSYRAPYAESMHSHEGPASRSRHTNHNTQDASPRASIARHYKPVSRYSEAISPGARRASDLPLPGFQYGSGPIPRDGEPLQNRPSGALAHNTPRIDPVWLDKLLTTAVKQGVEESRRIEEQSEGHTNHRKRNSEKEITSQAPGAWPESPFPTPGLVHHDLKRTPSSICDDESQPGLKWNQPQDGWGQSEARSRAAIRVNWDKEPAWETGSSNGNGWSSHEEIPSDSWDTEETWATNKAHQWETSSQPAKPPTTTYFKARPIPLETSHTHDQRRSKHSSKKHQSRSKSRTRRSRNDYEVTSSSSEDKDYIRIEPPSDSVVSVSSSNETIQPSQFRIERQVPYRSKGQSRRSKSAKRDSDRTPSRRSSQISTLRQASVGTVHAPSVVTRMTSTIMNAPIQIAPTQPQPQQPSVNMNPATFVLPAPDWAADVHKLMRKDTSVTVHIDPVPYLSSKTGFAQRAWGFDNESSRSTPSSSWGSGNKGSAAKGGWEDTTLKKDDWGADKDAGWEKAEPRSYNKNGWDTTDDDEVGGWDEGGTTGWGTKDAGWGTASIRKEKTTATKDLIGLKNVLENALNKKPQEPGLLQWQDQPRAIQNENKEPPGVQSVAANSMPSTPPAEKPTSRRHSNKSLSRYRHLRPDLSCAPTIKPHWQFPPLPSTKPIRPISEDQTYIAPKEPRYIIDQATAGEKGLEHQVRAGKATDYGHAVGRPEYLDSLDKPYAVFRFKYRSPEVLTALFGDETKAKNESNTKARGEEVEKLKALPQEELIAKMLRLESKLAETKASEKNKNKHGDKHKRDRHSNHHVGKKDNDAEKKRRGGAQTDQVARNLTELWVKRHSRDPSEKAGSRHAEEAALKDEGDGKEKKKGHKEKREGSVWGDGDVTW